jgi:hypothetical protein
MGWGLSAGEDSTEGQRGCGRSWGEGERESRKMRGEKGVYEGKAGFNRLSGGVLGGRYCRAGRGQMERKGVGEGAVGVCKGGGRVTKAVWRWGMGIHGRV